MLYDYAFVAGLFITRIVLPIALTLILGEAINRRLHRGTVR